MVCFEAASAQPQEPDYGHPAEVHNADYLLHPIISSLQIGIYFQAELNPAR